MQHESSLPDSTPSPTPQTKHGEQKKSIALPLDAEKVFLGIDLDKTLIGKGGVIEEKLVLALKAAQAKGIPIYIITKRSIEELLRGFKNFLEQTQKLIEERKIPSPQMKISVRDLLSKYWEISGFQCILRQLRTHGVAISDNHISTYYDPEFKNQGEYYKNIDTVASFLEKRIREIFSDKDIEFESAKKIKTLTFEIDELLEYLKKDSNSTELRKEYAEIQQYLNQERALPKQSSTPSLRYGKDAQLASIAAKEPGRSGILIDDDDRNLHRHTGKAHAPYLTKPIAGNNYFFIKYDAKNTQHNADAVCRYLGEIIGIILPEQKNAQSNAGKKAEITLIEQKSIPQTKNGYRIITPSQFFNFPTAEQRKIVENLLAKAKNGNKAAQDSLMRIKKHKHYLERPSTIIKNKIAEFRKKPEQAGENFFALSVELQRPVQMELAKASLAEKDSKSGLNHRILENIRQYAKENNGNKDKIYKKADRILAASQKNRAIARIQLYLSQTNHPAKTKFFTDLKQKIEKDGLNYQDLLAEYQKTDLTILFQNFRGARYSEAAKCLFDLFLLAKLQPLAKEPHKTHKTEFNNMLNGEFTHEAKKVSREDESKKIRRQYIENAISPTQQIPENAEQLQVRNIIQQEISQYKDAIIRDAALQRSEAIAIYHQYIINQAVQNACDPSNNEKIRFDPQGRVLIDIELKDGEYKKILSSLAERGINIEFKEEKEISDQQRLEKVLGNGNPLTSIIHCSLDINMHRQLEEKFCDWLLDEKSGTPLLEDKSCTQSPEVKSNAQLLREKLKKIAFYYPTSGSIIPLQEEMEGYAGVKLRTFAKLYLKKFPDAEINWNSMRLRLFKEINTLLKEKLQAVLIKLPAKKHSIVILNQELDKLRKVLAKEINIKFNSLLEEWDGEKFKNFIRDDIRSETLTHEQKADIQEAFVSTTSTQYDTIRADRFLGLVEYLPSSNNTAHHKQKDTENKPTTMAVRTIHRSHLMVTKKEEGQLSYTTTPILDCPPEIRVPSIAIPSDRLERKDAAKDVALKLKTLAKIFDDTRAMDSHSPRIYYLLTSLLSKGAQLVDKDNKQTESAIRIFHGTHLYNLSQLTEHKPHELFYIQNLGINQFSYALSFTNYEYNHRASPVVKEATLMAGLSFLKVLDYSRHLQNKEMSGLIHNEYVQAHKLYTEFLLANKTQSNLHFCDSPQGAQLFKRLENFKQIVLSHHSDSKREIDINHPLAFRELMAKAYLRIVFSENLQSLEYATLIQSVGHFFEAGVLGCKSGSERYAMVSGRSTSMIAVMLKQMENRSSFKDFPDTTPEKQLFNALKTLANCRNIDFLKYLNTFNEALDRVFAAYNLNGSNTICAHQELGTSKVSTQQLLRPKLFTNYCETVPVSSTNASKLQPHKSNFREDLLNANLFTEKQKQRAQNPDYEATVAAIL